MKKLYTTLDSFKESINESYIDTQISDYLKKNDMKIFVESKIKKEFQEMVKSGFIDNDTESLILHWYNYRRHELNHNFSKLSKKETPNIKVYNDILSKDSYAQFLVEGSYHAWIVSKRILDKIANDEPIEDAYYEMKEYYNNMDIEWNRSRTFEYAVNKLEKWMTKNNKKIK